jgi:hypothetical protein
MGLFNIPDELLSESEPDNALHSLIGSNSTVSSFASPMQWDERCPFELRIIPEQQPVPTGQVSYRLALFQRLVHPPSAQTNLSGYSRPALNGAVELGGSQLKAVADQVLDALRDNGFKATDLSANRRKPFALTEESGVRLGLLFLAVRPIIKMTRVENISMGIRSMTSEEFY